LSSILEALRKAEKESPKLDFTPELTEGVNTRRAVSRRARSSRVAYRLIVSTIVVVILCAGTWFAFSGKARLYEKALPNQPAPDLIEKASVTGSSESTGQAPIVENPPVVASLDSSTPRPTTAEPLETPLRVPVQAPEMNEPGPKEKVMQEARAIRKEELPSKPSKLPVENHLDNAKYKLEAIVWAESPESRFAVINGQIVRIGGTLEGLSLISIDRDHVAVRSSGREWKMKFIVE
jgi:hypothetical protein